MCLIARDIRFIQYILGISFYFIRVDKGVQVRYITEMSQQQTDRTVNAKPIYNSSYTSSII